jgi:hypothetical protein
MGTMSPRRNAIGAFMLALTSIALLVYVPVFVGFGVTVLTAVSWCIWLEEHPPA